MSKGEQPLTITPRELVNVWDQGQTFESPYAIRQALFLFDFGSKEASSFLLRRCLTLFAKQDEQQY